MRGTNYRCPHIIILNNHITETHTPNHKPQQQQKRLHSFIHKFTTVCVGRCSKRQDCHECGWNDQETSGKIESTASFCRSNVRGKRTKLITY